MAGPGGYTWAQGPWGPQWVYQYPVPVIPTIPMIPMIPTIPVTPMTPVMPVTPVVPAAAQLARQTGRYTVDPHNNAEFQAVVDLVPDLRELDMGEGQACPFVPFTLRRMSPPPVPCLHTLILSLQVGVDLISQLLRANEPTLRELSLAGDGLTTLLLPNDADILMEELGQLTRLTKLHLRADVRALNQPFIFNNRGRLREVDIILLDYSKDTIQSIIYCNRGTLLAEHCFLAFIDGDSTTYAQNAGRGRHFHLQTLSWLKLDCTGPLSIAPLADFFE